MHRLKSIVLLTLAFTCFLTERASAEDLPKNEVYFGWGPKAVFRKDQIKSPRLYSGPAALSFLTGYNRTNEADAHRLSLGFLQSTVRSQKDWQYTTWPDEEDVTTQGDPITSVRLRYAYLRAVYSDGPWRINVGPAFDADIQQATYLAGPYGVDGHFGVLALDARAEATFQPSAEHQLSGNIALPLFAWVARSSYALVNDEIIMANIEHKPVKTFFRYIGRGQFRTWNQVQAVRLAAKYRYQPTPRWSFSAEVESRFLAISTPRPLLAHDHGLNLTASYHF